MPGSDGATHLKSLLAEAAGLIAELGGPAGAAEAPGRPTPGDRHAEALRELDAMQDPAGDGRIEVTVAADGMSARVHLDPPTGERSSVDEDAVIAALRDRGVTTGIERQAVREVVRRCVVDRVLVRDAVVARGSRPVDEVPPGLAIEPHLLRAPSRDAAAGTDPVDFHSFSPFIAVKAGEVLARAIPGRPGAMGMTVRGMAVPYSRVPDVWPRPGSNTRREGEVVVAACDGLFKSDEGFFRVDEVLVVPGDVDFSVGNIDFPGDVVIHGLIRDGFRVRAGRSLYCAKSIDASEVVTGADLVTAHGIIGRRTAVIRAGGGITARFIENCVVEATGTIRVQAGVMSSSLHTLGGLDMGGRGVLVGSVVVAREGVVVGQIGSSRAPRSEVRCGIDYTVERSLAELRDRAIALAPALRRLEERRRREPTAAVAALIGRIRGVLRGMNDAARTLVAYAADPAGIRVSVRGVVHPGTVVEIGPASYIVPRQLNAVTFRLERATGRIVTARFEPGSPTVTAPAAPRGAAVGRS